MPPSATTPALRPIASPVLSPIEAPPPDAPTTQPELIHSLKHASTILALIVSPRHGCIFAGTQDGEIVAWSLATFQQVHKVQAHKRSVLSLFLSPDATLLFSSAGDPIINVWAPETLSRVYEIYSTHDVGDIFCTAYSAQHDTLYIGAQNASIQWVSLNDPSVKVAPGSMKHPDRRNHRFFDSKAVGGGASTPRRNEDRWALIPKPLHVLEVNDEALRNFAHNGYVYCMLMAKGPTVEVDAEADVLISGGGDGTIKLWNLGSSDKDEASDPEDHIQEIMTLGQDDAESVLSLAIDGSFLYAGKLDGVVELWDLDTAQKLRVIRAHDRDIMSLQMGWGYLWIASTDGWVSVSNSIRHLVQLLMYPRNTALLTTESTSMPSRPTPAPVPGRSASSNGAPTKARSWPRLRRLSTTASSTLLVQMTTIFRYGPSRMMLGRGRLAPRTGRMFCSAP